MTHTPKQTDVQGRGVVLRLEPGVVAHDCRTGVSVCLPLGPETWFPSVFAEVADRAGGQRVSTVKHCHLDSTRVEALVS